MKAIERLTCSAAVRTAILAIGAMTCLVLSSTPAAASDTSVRPFRINVPDEALTDLRERLLATRWPDKETVDDRSQGVQLAKLQELVRYWGTGYDWRTVEAKLNALPQFVTTIDGLDIHFIHVRSRHPDALAVVITHGWPGSVIEQLGIIAPLTDPTAHGGRAQDAFHVVIPSMPGFGFSGKPTGTGITRTPVVQHDLAVPGREVLQVRVDFAEGTAFGRHSHPGAEIAYVVEGTLEYQLDGKPPAVLHAGEALFIPAGTIHAAKNVGKGNAAELATYIVEKGKPLVAMAK